MGAKAGNFMWLSGLGKITFITAIGKRIVLERGMNVAVVNDHNRRARFVDDKCPPMELDEIKE